MTWSSCSSVVLAEFNAQYVSSFCMPKLNRSGSATTKSRYWSKSWAICSCVPAAAVCAAKLSRRGRGIEEVKLRYAGVYNPFCRSFVMAWRFCSFGSTRYITGTSGIGCREELMCCSYLVCYPDLAGFLGGPTMCIVTPMERRSLTRNTLDMTSRPRSSKTKTFHTGSPEELTMGSAVAAKPLLCVSPFSFVPLLRLKIFLMDAVEC